MISSPKILPLTFTVTLALGFYSSLSASAFPACFDFSKKITQPIREAIPPAKDPSPAQDQTQSGELPSGARWGAARGVVESSVSDLLKLLLDNNLTRNNRTTVINVTQENRAQYLDFHLVKVNVRPFPFVSLKWEEQWAYALADGTQVDPKTVAISYQKTAGEERLEHLCGSIILKKLTPKSTDVYLYEELIAPRRTAQETAEGHLGTLRALRKGITFER